MSESDINAVVLVVDDLIGFSVNPKASTLYDK